MTVSWGQIATSLLVSALTAVMGVFCRRISRIMKELKVSHEALMDGQRDSLRYQIVQAHDYFQAKGHIGKYSLDCIEAMYESYHKLGGNGFITSIMEDIRKLPIR